MFDIGHGDIVRQRGGESGTVVHVGENRNRVKMVTFRPWGNSRTVEARASDVQTVDLCESLERRCTGAPAAPDITGRWLCRACYGKLPRWGKAG